MLNTTFMSVIGSLLVLYGFCVIIFHQKIWNNCMERVKNQTSPSFIDKARNCSKLSRQLNRYVLGPLMILMGIGLIYFVLIPEHLNVNKKAYKLVLGGEHLTSIIVQKEALYPEGIDYNPLNDKFILGSFREGAVYEVGLDGSYKKIIDDTQLNSVLAVRVDTKRDRLLVVNSDIGSAIHSYNKGSKKLASMAIYKLSTGEAIHFINLGELTAYENHLANGMTIDSAGNAYVTDSFAPIIYKIDINGKASIFLENDKFLGKGINLNGIVYHPDGYLIAIKKGDGTLFKIPLDKPNDFSIIKCTKKFVGGDGLILVNNKKLVVVVNRVSGEITETAFALESNDDWSSAIVTNNYRFGKKYITTGVMRKNSVYILHSNLNQLISASKEKKSELTKKATIEQIGVVRD